MISKYDYKTKKYKKHITKWECSYLKKESETIKCANCGKPTSYAFTSETIIDNKGNQYLICKECLEREIYERRERDKE